MHIHSSSGGAGELACDGALSGEALLVNVRPAVASRSAGGQGSTCVGQWQGRHLPQLALLAK